MSDGYGQCLFLHQVDKKCNVLGNIFFDSELDTVQIAVANDAQFMALLLAIIHYPITC